MEKSGNCVRVNRDSLRKMLHFDKWSGVNEGKTKQAERVLIKTFLQQGLNVIVDDTNLNPGVLQGWEDLAEEVGAKIEYVKMDTCLNICLLRDSLREEMVGSYVICGMAMQYDLMPVFEKGIVICDIDGTLADIKHRLHFVQEGRRDWNGFFGEIGGDTVREDVKNMLEKRLGEGYDIFFVSGRPEEYRLQTEKFLSENFSDYISLFMRGRGDRRPDTEVKQEIYDRYFKKYSVVEVIDDRPRVIEMWRSNGLNVIDVGNGVDF